MPPRLASAACLIFLASSLTAQVCLPEPETAPAAKPPVRQVIFENASLLPDDKRQEIASAVRDDTAFDPAEGRSISTLAGVGAESVRLAYQDQGYLEAQVTGRAVLVGTGATKLYDVVIQVEETGPLDRFGDVKIVHATLFSELELRDLFPIQRGEIFSREKIAKGLENLRHLYDSAGYINMTAVPTTDFDEEHEMMNLLVDVDEGRQFRVRGVDVLGLDTENTSRVLNELAVKPGDIFTPTGWESAVRAFPNIAPDDAGIGQKKMDERNGWVDLVLDFRKPDSCGQTYSEPPRLQ